jgi:hypothetical protein
VRSKAGAHCGQAPMPGRVGNGRGLELSVINILGYAGIETIAPS